MPTQNKVKITAANRPRMMPDEQREDEDGDGEEDEEGEWNAGYPVLVIEAKVSASPRHQEATWGCKMRRTDEDVHSPRKICQSHDQRFN